MSAAYSSSAMLNDNDAASSQERCCSLVQAYGGWEMAAAQYWLRIWRAAADDAVSQYLARHA